MSTTEADRHHLIERASDVLGREAAMTLAEHLPPTGWGDVATTADLAALEARIDHRFETLAARVEAQFATSSARTDTRLDRIDARFEVIDERFKGIDERFKGIDERFEGLEAQFRDRFDADVANTDLRFEGFDHRIEGVRHEVIGAIHESAVAQTRLFIFAMISTLTSVAGIALAAARLGS